MMYAGDSQKAAGGGNLSFAATRQAIQKSSSRSSRARVRARRCGLGRGVTAHRLGAQPAARG
eukprot:14590615-Heterocapsa_arctica.AAC.1